MTYYIDMTLRTNTIYHHKNFYQFQKILNYWENNFLNSIEFLSIKCFAKKLHFSFSKGINFFPGVPILEKKHRQISV